MGESDRMDDHVARSPRDGRHTVLALVVAVLALTVIVAWTVTGGTLPPGEDGDGATQDAGTSLEAALADGKPIYILIHSLT